MATQAMSVQVLLDELQGLLLGPDEDDVRQNAPHAPAPPHQAGGTSRTQQQLLQQLIEACLSAPSGALTAFCPHSGSTAFSLLLASLQQGYLEAAQLLLLLQLLHEQQQQLQSSNSLLVEEPAGADHDGQSAAGTSQNRDCDSAHTPKALQDQLFWPGFVVNRLASLVRFNSQQHNSQNTILTVVSLRLLAVTAAAVKKQPLQLSVASPAGLPDAILQLLQQAAVVVAAAAMDGPAYGGTEALGPDIASALGHLATSCAGLPAQKAPAGSRLQPQSSTPAAADDASSTTTTTSSSSSCAPELPSTFPETAASPDEGAASAQSCLQPAGGRGGTTPLLFTAEAAAQMLLQLCQMLQHQPTPYSTAAEPPAKPPITSPDHEHCWQQLLQMQMLIDLGDAQLAHWAAAPAREPPATAGKGSGPGRQAAAAIHCTSACCTAGFEVLQNLTAMVLQDEVGLLATSTELTRGVLRLLRQLMSQSPSITVPKLDWLGKVCGYQLSPSAAAPCKCLVTRSAAAAGISAASLASGTSSSSSAAAAGGHVAPASLVPWHAAGVAEVYSSWLQVWGLQQASSLLQAALHLLLAVCQRGSWAAAAQLYAADVSSVLEQLGKFAAPEVHQVLMMIYRCCCLYSNQLRDEVMQDADMLALSALILSPTAATVSMPAGNNHASAPATPASVSASATASATIHAQSRITSDKDLTTQFSRQNSSSSNSTTSNTCIHTSALCANKPQTAACNQPPVIPVKLQLAALSRLSSVMHSASGHHFMTFVGAVSRATASRAGTSNSSSSSCGLSAVIAILQDGLLTEQESFAGAHFGQRAISQQQALQQKQQLLDYARQVYLAALDRARQMQHLNRNQMPRGGHWSNMHGSVLRRLEAWALHPTASAELLNTQHTEAGSGSSRSVGPAPAMTPTSGAARNEAGSGHGGSSSSGGRSGQGQVTFEITQDSNSNSTHCVVALSPNGGIGNVAATAGASGRRSSGSARCAASGSRRRIGSAASSKIVTGCNAAAEAEARESAQGQAGGFDEDGIRVVWSSGPSAAALESRAVWKQLQLSECLSWTQSSSDLEMRLLLPAGTRKQDVVVSIQPDRLTVRLSWYGRVLDGPLKKRVKSSEACWSLGSAHVNLGRILASRPNNSAPGTSASSSGSNGSTGSRQGGSNGSSSKLPSEVELVELLVVLPKEESGRYWRALFEGGEEKGHLQVLQEALSNEDDARHAPTVDQLGPEAALLLEELRERQELMVSGQWSIENSFDDFRLVLGDNLM